MRVAYKPGGALVDRKQKDRRPGTLLFEADVPENSPDLDPPDGALSSRDREPPTRIGVDRDGDQKIIPLLAERRTSPLRS
jgi:hypothetical protein